MIKEIEVAELQALLDSGAKLVDVREEEELESGIIPGSIHLPLSSLDECETKFRELGPKVIFYCRSGKRSMRAAAMADDWGSGSSLFSLKGGYLAYQDTFGNGDG